MQSVIMMIKVHKEAPIQQLVIRIGQFLSDWPWLVLVNPIVAGGSNNIDAK